MQMTVAFLTFSLVLIKLAGCEAQYPPSGYRPPGRQFQLPKVQQNQYEAPQLPSLPVLPPVDFRSSTLDNRQSNNQNSVFRYAAERDRSNREEQNSFINQDFVRNNQQYGAPVIPNRQTSYDQPPQQAPPSFKYGFDQGVDFDNRNRYDSAAGTSFDTSNLNQYGPPNRRYANIPNLNAKANANANARNQPNPFENGFNQNNAVYSTPSVTTQHTVARNFGQESSNSYENQQYDFTKQIKQNPRVPQNNQQFGSSSNSKLIPQFNNNKQLYQTPNNQYGNNDFSRDVDDDDTVGIANQSYLPPSTTEGLDKRPVPNPDTQEAVDTQEDTTDPNFSIATAVAKSQYYLVEPNSNLQRVNYQTVHADELKSNEYPAKLDYPNVASAMTPFYSYNTPGLIRLY
ncbi:hypothetical protein FQA39_LY15432 [Lamprigera yunnana]|nr:hypothetical protein FQA39_LY15432 [Lamprigera yunnana]